MIIESMLDNDLYKFPMQQAVLHQFSDVMVEYKFLIGELADQRYATGRVGLYVYNMKAHFDNVVIVGEDIPENDFSTSSVEGPGKLAATWAETKFD